VQEPQTEQQRRFPAAPEAHVQTQQERKSHAAREARSPEWRVEKKRRNDAFRPPPSLRARQNVKLVMTEWSVFTAPLRE